MSGLSAASAATKMRSTVISQSENRRGRQERQVAIFVDSRGVRAASHISKDA